MTDLTIDVEDLLANTNIDDVEDLPEFVNPVPGLWNLAGKSVKIGKTTAEHSKVSLTFVLGEPVELNNPDDFNPELFPVGSLVSISAYGTKDDPQLFLKQLKKMFGKTMAEHNIGNFAEFLEQFDSLSFVGVMGLRTDRDNPEIKYSELKEAVIA